MASKLFTASSFIITLLGCRQFLRGVESASGVAHEFPKEQMVDPEGQEDRGRFTYLGDPEKTSCTEMNPAPLSQPSQPTVQEAIAFCNSHKTCGGFTYMTGQANNALIGNLYSSATYCQPNTFLAGAKTVTSAIAYLKYVYHRCDLQVTIGTTVAGHYGNIVDTRKMCVRQRDRGRVASSHSGWGGGHRTPSQAAVSGATGSQMEHEVVVQPPNFKILIGGVEFEVGKNAFISEAVAKAQSRDGGAHTRVQDTTLVTYYIPGATAAVYDEGKWRKPFAKDRFYPLFNTRVEAEAFSTAAGGNGEADVIGPGSGMNPDHWSDGTYGQYYVPRFDPRPETFRTTRNWHYPGQGPVTFTGYVEAMSLDGYYPLYDTCAQASAFSYGPGSFKCRSYGPGSDAGVPVRWSTGERRLYYMPLNYTHPDYGFTIPAFTGHHLDGYTEYKAGYRSGDNDFYTDNKLVRSKLPFTLPAYPDR